MQNPAQILGHVPLAVQAFPRSACFSTANFDAWKLGKYVEELPAFPCGARVDGVKPRAR
jgi:hypothetical protein